MSQHTNTIRENQIEKPSNKGTQHCQVIPSIQINTADVTKPTIISEGTIEEIPNAKSRSKSTVIKVNYDIPSEVKKCPQKYRHQQNQYQETQTNYLQSKDTRIIFCHHQHRSHHSQYHCCHCCHSSKCLTHNGDNHLLTGNQ